ncbi:UNVERIFIED_CONTAM: hypothetical protein FKN15_059710 [Acipenser sinensis]
MFSILPGWKGHLVDSHPAVSRFHKGINHLRPPRKQIIPQWSLDLVLDKLMGPPFEPMATCNENFLTWKTAFLVAVMSSRTVSELQAPVIDAPYFQSFRDRIVCRPNPQFLPKVVTSFHINQVMTFHDFYQNHINQKRRLDTT